MSCNGLHFPRSQLIGSVNSDWSVKSTLASCSGSSDEDDEENISDLGATSVAIARSRSSSTKRQYLSSICASIVIFCLCRCRHCPSAQSRIRTCIKSTGLLVSLLGILASVIGVMVFIGVPVVSLGSQRYIYMDNLTTLDPDYQTMANLSSLVVSDLRLVEDTEEQGIFLQDSIGYQHVNVVQQQNQQSTPSPQQQQGSAWDQLQPTVESLQQMEGLPHVQISTKAKNGMNDGNNVFLEVDPSYDIRSDHNWTLSFAGARLPSRNSDFDVIFDSSLLPCQIRYEDNNVLGIYTTSIPMPARNSNHGSAVGYTDDGNAAGGVRTKNYQINLPSKVYDFHVLTFSYDQTSLLVTVYQNLHPVAVVDFEDGWAVFNMIGSHGGQKEGGTYFLPSSSNLAIRRISYFYQSFHHGDEELEKLVQYMML